jgi:hypothetical protein
MAAETKLNRLWVSEARPGQRRAAAERAGCVGCVDGEPTEDHVHWGGGGGPGQGSRRGG